MQNISTVKKTFHSSGATGYKITTTLDGDVASDVTTSNSVVTISGLSPGVVYDFTIQSIGTKDRLNSEESVSVTQQTGKLYDVT